MATATETIRQRYDRIAPYFDTLEAGMETMLFGRLRQRLWARVGDGKVLEVGVGTGKNFPYYPTAADITAIDFSPAMLERARRKAEKSALAVDLRLMDAECLDFPEHSFDTAIASFVFCSVPDPLRGLAELRRVLKPGGRLLLLEHVLSSKPWLAALMRRLNPLVVTAFGANIDRDTVGNVARAGFTDIAIDPVSGDIVKLLEARKPA